MSIDKDIQDLKDRGVAYHISGRCWGIISYDEIKRDSSNPFYERWKRGRPSKEAIQKRKNSDYWQTLYYKKFPTPMMKFLSGDSPIMKKDENGKLTIRYVQRPMK